MPSNPPRRRRGLLCFSLDLLRTYPTSSQIIVKNGTQLELAVRKYGLRYGVRSSDLLMATDVSVTKAVERTCKYELSRIYRRHCGLGPEHCFNFQQNRPFFLVRSAVPARSFRHKSNTDLQSSHRQDDDNHGRIGWSDRVLKTSHEFVPVRQPVQFGQDGESSELSSPHLNGPLYRTKAPALYPGSGQGSRVVMIWRLFGNLICTQCNSLSQYKMAQAK